MKKITSALTAVLLAASALSALPMAASAEEYVYGTMNIPYADFYRAELVASNNAYEVDAVSSATAQKSKKNGEGELFEGTFYEETSGTVNAIGNEILVKILGVTYPVALTQADLDALGENNYGFTPLDAQPEAYKIVTVQDGAASFSAVQDAQPQTVTADVALSTATPWGDYLMEFKNTPEGFNTLYRGAIVKTTDGKAFAMRHEQNIWRGELAWSSGITVSEPHGNALDYANYTDLMGSTVNEVVFIGLDGYTTLSTNTYIPKKFESTLTIENAPVSAGKTTFTTEGFPADYAQSYSVGDGFTVTAGEITYSGVQPGSYTLTISDANGTYADVTGNFVLSTADVPVQFDGEKLVAAPGFTDADAANFIAKLSKVKVGETEYSASGKGAVAIINTDGTINQAAASGRGDEATPVFGGSGDYALTLTATGYDTPYSFTLTIGAAETTVAETTTAAGTTTTGSKSTTTTAGKGGTTTTASSTASPKTGDASAALPLAAAAVAAGAAVIAVSRRRK